MIRWAIRQGSFTQMHTRAQLQPPLHAARSATSTAEVQPGLLDRPAVQTNAAPHLASVRPGIKRDVLRSGHRQPQNIFGSGDSLPARPAQRRQLSPGVVPNLWQRFLLLIRLLCCISCGIAGPRSCTAGSRLLCCTAATAIAAGTGAAAAARCTAQQQLRQVTRVQHHQLPVAGARHVHLQAWHSLLQRCLESLQCVGRCTIAAVAAMGTHQRWVGGTKGLRRLMVQCMQLPRVIRCARPGLQAGSGRWCAQVEHSPVQKGGYKGGQKHGGDVAPAAGGAALLGALLPAGTSGKWLG